MAKPAKFYLSHINKQTGYRATWDPGKPLKLGQIGKLDDYGVFNVYTSLEGEGIAVQTAQDGTAGDLDYTSSDSVTISTKLSGSAPVVGSGLSAAQAGFSFDFKSEKSVVFQASGITTSHITNLAAIEKAILEKYRAGNWDKNWLIITELVTAASATIIIVNSSTAKLDLKAQADISSGTLKLTDASLGLSVAREQGSTLKYISQSGLTPLYRVMGIVSPLFGKQQLGTRSVVEEGEQLRFSVQEFNEQEID